MYGTQKAVDNISFSVQKGEVVGFLGPNGAGKSTTMKMATGYTPPSEGKILISGLDVVEKNLAIRKKIGYLPEHNPLYLDMYVHEYLAFIADVHRIDHKKKRIASLISMCGLTREQHKKIETLSKGYRQRIGIAQALIHDPEVLILDEPTTGLDPNQILEIRKLIKNVSEEKTVIFSTHIMQEVEAMCDRVLIINKGQLIADDSVNALKAQQQQQQVLQVTFSSALDADVLRRLDYVLSVTAVSERTYDISYKDKALKSLLLSEAAKQQWPLESMKERESSLESIFHSLTNTEVKV